MTEEKIVNCPICGRAMFCSDGKCFCIYHGFFDMELKK